MSRDKRLFLHYIGNPRNPKREMIIPFVILATGTSKNKGVAPPLRQKSLKHETRNVKAVGSHFSILATGTSKNKGVVPPVHRESLKRETRKVSKSHFGISATGTSKNKGAVPPLHRESPKTETRNAKSVQEPFRHFSYRDFKEQRSISSTASGIAETRNAKCESCPGAISAFRLLGCQETKGRSSTASEIPETRNMKCEKRPRAISAFRLPGLQKTIGYSLFVFSVSTTLHGKTS
jgi:hypothetical protein